MSKLNFNALSFLCSDLGFSLSKTVAGVYRITGHGEYGPAFEGTFAECRVWMLGLDYGHTQIKAAFMAYKDERLNRAAN